MGHAFGNKSSESEAISLRHSASAPSRSAQSAEKSLLGSDDISVHAHEFKNNCSLR